MIPKIRFEKQRLENIQSLMNHYFLNSATPKTKGIKQSKERHRATLRRF